MRIPRSLLEKGDWRGLINDDSFARGYLLSSPFKEPADTLDYPEDCAKIIRRRLTGTKFPSTNTHDRD